MGIERFSSRRQALGTVLGERLNGATRYLRIAGYFRSSLLEVVGEALDTVGEIRVVCNGDLDPFDVKVAKAARDGQSALAQTLVSSWQSTEDGLDLLLARERYRRLHDLLGSRRMKVRVVPRDGDNVFVHGKAGVIEHADGKVFSFVGSMNDSASGLRHAYEIIWGDEDPAAADWVRDEFEHFWAQGVDLPDAVVKHVAAMASRTEYRSIEDARDATGEISPDAVLAERPIYKGGQILRPWQKRFVQTCVDDHRLYGQARFLIADDVGLGKTLSMAAAALVLSMLDDKPVLILAPATLIWQWQEELEDKLGIPAAVWSSQKKCWLDGERRPLTQKGDPSFVARCPWRIGIVSTGLIVNGDDNGERGTLTKKSFGVVILDEAHKARASRETRRGHTTATRNNLLDFLHKVARNATNVILGTATPIQLDAVELWDIIAALSQGAPQVLGTPFDGGEWMRDDSIRLLTGERPWPQNETSRWGLFRNPLPPASEHSVFRDVRNDARLHGREVLGPRFDELGPDVRDDFLQDFNTLAEQHNPIVRRIVRRTRPMLEERGLLKRIGVITHPRSDDGLSASFFNGQGLVMGLAFTAAYEAAENFSRIYAARRPGAGFLKTILLRRIGSSARAGLETARHLLNRIDTGIIPEDEIGDEATPTDDTPPDPQEIHFLREVERNLAAVVDGSDVDPKVQVILHYLRERRWLELNGAIIFSQYRTTAEWILEALCAAFPDEPVALYAGGSASFVQRGVDRRTAAREQIKGSIQRGDIRLVCATDAACEGLNLQRLGAQVNVDLPWNPSRLEQRKGRVQRIGQVRDEVHVLNLRYAGTVEDDVYAALSDRFGDIFSVLGQLPDGFEDQWIDAVLQDRQAVKNFSQRVEKAKPPMELRYLRDVADDRGLDWEYTERVLSSRDLDEWMRRGWP
ncbi:superfamily II DNA or RNA helicase [Phyllobacterium sp. 1468]|uniref:helicase-related protein n=1 Tax=Phyllobacterium sp. 1468 TaxID=2817759 RepID=UPI0028617EF9|nr:helicase-related protein [Phyllobacterium sp. 1468]MDR6632295.1 superfamily II DNA or RNA helicase [Phyllobacterium sp. 1468]